MSKELLFALVGTLLLCVSAAAYRNPLTLPSEKMGAGIADPGLLRWMGKYYLYATKVAEDPGIRCWESEDLVNWTYKGFCTGNDPAFGSGHAWSPGPFYYNGKFYLYVSGVEQKHRVFEADAPTAPFKCVNNDLLDVNSLDAVPLLDDDGRLYLFYAGWAGVGIQYRECSSPIKADGPNQTLPACQFSADNNGNFWTEGPSLYKHNGTYYLAYCGNDWLKDSYQVRVAKGRTIADLKPQKTNPLLSQLTGDWVATGCNWIIRGPDLKSVWNVYHCRRFGGHARRMCLDSLYFDKKTGDLCSNGPTWDTQPNPASPDWHESFNRDELGPTWQVASGKWDLRDRERAEGQGDGGSAELLCKAPVNADFVAEFNVKLLGETTAGDYGVVLRSDEAAILLDVASKSLRLVSRKGSDSRVVAKFTLPAAFDLGAWHQIVVEKSAGRVRVYFDQMLAIDQPLGGAQAHFSLVANKCNAAFGWCGFSNYRDGETP